MPDVPAEINDIDDVKRWIADHDGRINAYWAAQFKYNEKAEKRLDGYAVRLTGVEKKMFWIAGFAAAVGSVGGSLAVNFLGGGGG